MPAFQVRNPGFRDKVRKGFEDQGIMRLLGAELIEVEPGRIIIEQALHDGLKHQHGSLHGGVVAALLDSACGFSAVTLLPAENGITTIEFKVNFLAAGQGEKFRFVGEVLKPGRTITVSEGRAYALANGREKLIASMTATNMTILP